MTPPKALIFDVGGTVFDWKSTILKALCGDLSQTSSKDIHLKFAEDWRAEMFLRRGQIAEGHRPWENSDAMLLAGLQALKPKYDFIENLDCDISFVRDIWHNLQTFNGASAAIAKLRKSYLVTVLSILSWESILKSSKRAGLSWDGILSCEFLGYYKPSLMAYSRAVTLLGLEANEAMMVASHEADLAAAKTAGLQTAYISPILKDDIFSADFATTEAFNFDMTATSFDDLCKQLGC